MPVPIRPTTTNLGAVPVYEEPSNGGALSVVLSDSLAAMPVILLTSFRAGAIPIRYAGTSWTPPPDITPPTLSSATIDATGLIMTLVFNESVTGHDGFTVDPSGAAATLAYDSGDGTNTLVFDISREITEDETVTLDYTPGDVEDASANALEAIADFEVTNNSEVEVQTEEVYAFLDLAGTADTIMTPTVLNAGMKGAIPGSWEYGAGKHSGVDVNPLTFFNHTLLRADAITLDPPILCDGDTFESASRSVEWDQSDAVAPLDWETIRWVPGETVDGNTLVRFVFEMNRSLGADTDGTSIDVNSIYYGGVFAVLQQKMYANGIKIIRSHNGGLAIPIENDVVYDFINFADKANQTNVVVAHNHDTGEFVGAGESPFLVAEEDDLTFIIAGDYLLNGDGQQRISALRFNPNEWAVFPTFVVPAPSGLTATQTGVGTVEVAGQLRTPRFKIERSVNGSGVWATLNGDYGHNLAVSAEDPDFTYEDATASDGVTYLYRASGIVGSNTGTPATTSPITINDALYAVPVWTDAAASGSTTNSETNGAAVRQDLVCGTTGNCVKLRVYRRGGGSVGTAKMSLHGSTGTLLGQGTIANADLGTDGNWIECTLASPVAVASGTTYRIGFMPSSSAGIHTGMAPTGTASFYDFSTTFAAFPPNPYNNANSGTRTFAVGMGVV
jgi:hypothetical protein